MIQVLTPQDIKDIEKEVLKAIPDGLVGHDVPPEFMYHQQEMPKGPSYSFMTPDDYSVGGPKMTSNGMMPGFMSALSPSVGMISDWLKPLLKKVRPRIPASPARQVHSSRDSSGGGGNNYPIEQIPAGAPYSSHRPENLDVIHFISNKSSYPSSMHVNQLFNFRKSGSGSGPPAINSYNQESDKMLNSAYDQMQQQFQQQMMMNHHQSPEEHRKYAV